jgi:uncharacterized protein (PEP-CTERM system associated)
MAMGVDRKPRDGIQRLFLLGVGMGCVVFPVFAGDWKITPTISVNETATDNVTLSNTHKQSDLISDINPGILLDGSGGRSKLHFDYQLHNLIYAQNSARNNTQNSLNAFGTLEALDNWLFIDASGVISQQSISAFGGASSTAVNTNVNNNTTEASTYRISPYIRGTLGSAADYQLRYSQSSTNTKSSNAFNSDTNELIATLKGVTALTNLRWSLDASGKTIKFGNGVSNDDDRVRGVLTYALDPQFRVSLIGGREANNYLSQNKEGHTTKGAGFEWAPTERTQISASRESRFFGNSNSFSFSHRTAGTAWRYSESKDATVLPNQQVGLGTVYDQFFTIFLSSSTLCPQSDAALKAACANEGASRVASLFPANASRGFLTSGVTLQQRREASFALLGARNTVTFAATQTESQNLSQRAGTGLLAGEDFSNAQNIRQRGASINWSNKLTALSSLTGSFSRMVSTGTGSTSLEMVQKMLNLSFLTQLGPKTYASIGARRVVVDGTTTYSENALLFTLSHQF